VELARGGMTMPDARYLPEAGALAVIKIAEVARSHIADLELAHDDTAVCRETLRQKMAEFERALILQALETARGNKAKAARILGITERIMGLRVEKYAIDPKVFRLSG